MEVKLIWSWEPHEPDDMIIKLRWLDRSRKSIDSRLEVLEKGSGPLIDDFTATDVHKRGMTMECLDRIAAKTCLGQ